MDAFERGDLNATVDGFNTITECGSRISFNLGVIYASIDRHEDAIVSFTNATIQDPYLAVAFVQLATSQWMMGDYDSAIEALSNAYLCMRGNLSIAYAQLGLDYTLFSFEILFNRILCYLTIGKWDDAM